MELFLKYWMPAISWMGIIYLGSTDMLSAEHTSRFLVPFLRWLDPQISMATIAAIHFALRKFGHLTEYAILAALIWRALRSGTSFRMKMSPDPAQPGSSFKTGVIIPPTTETEGAGRSSLIASTGCPWVRSRSILFILVWLAAAI